MKICTFVLKGEREPTSRPRIGMLRDGFLEELGELATITDLLSAGTLLGELHSSGVRHPMGDVVIRAPIPRPGKILAAIVNTKGMLGGEDVVLEWPRIDMKAPSTVIGPDEKIIAPKRGIRPEVELAAVVGTLVSGANLEEARRSIFGYTILNDVTAPSDSLEDAYEAYRRDVKTGKIEKRTLRGPLFRSKNHDTFCPLGPWVVTADELGPVEGRRMSTKFGDMRVQEGSTSEYIFAPEAIVSYISGFLTLEPGDIVSCGSVGWTSEALGKLDPTEFVLPQINGTLELEIEGIGTLRNQVVV